VYLFHTGIKLIVTPREEHKSRVFENRVLRKIFVPRKEGMGKNAAPIRIMRSFIISSFQQILLLCQIKGDDMGETCSTDDIRKHTKYR
jgi:hypothetical protein